VLFPQVRSLSRFTSNLLTSAWPLWADHASVYWRSGPHAPSRRDVTTASSRNPSAEKPGLAEDRAQGSAGQLPVHGHDHRAAIDVTELHMAPTLPHAFEACFPQSPGDFGP
jgi:hypothetical protein